MHNELQWQCTSNIMATKTMRNITIHNEYNEQFIKWITITMHNENNNNEPWTMTMKNNKCQWAMIAMYYNELQYVQWNFIVIHC